MPHAVRTSKDRTYRDLVIRYGQLTNTELCRKAREMTGFGEKEMSDSALEKDVDRFVKYHLEMGTLTRGEDGKLNWSQPHPRPDQPILSNEGFLTSRAGVKCEHCGRTIDLAAVELRWRPKSPLLARALHVHHFFRVTCPNCGFEGRYDTGKDVKPILQ